MSRASDLKIIEIGPIKKKKVIHSSIRHGHPSTSILADITRMSIKTN